MDSAKSIRFCGNRTWGHRDVRRLFFVLYAVQVPCERESFMLESRESHKRTLSNLRSGRKLVLHPRRWPNPRGAPTLLDISPDWFARAVCRFGLGRRRSLDSSTRLRLNNLSNVGKLRRTMGDWRRCGGRSNGYATGYG
jgi:hypothetical protein